MFHTSGKLLSPTPDIRLRISVFIQLFVEGIFSATLIKKGHAYLSTMVPLKSESGRQRRVFF